jgi:hypothetical protein
MNVTYIYDAGALIAFDANNRLLWSIHKTALKEGREIVIPAIVVGQAWRDGSRQAQLSRLLRACEIEPTGLETAKAAGVLCGQAQCSDVVDATVIVTALAHNAVIFTSDPEDMAKLADASRARPRPVVVRV